MSPEPESCGVCGRNILHGERTQEFINPNGETAGVCDLCRPRVQRAGWLRADSEAAQAAASERRSSRGRGGARQLIESVRQRRRAVEESVRERRRGAEDPEPERAAPASAKHPDRARTATAEPPRPVPRKRPGPETPERRLRRALEHFNATEHRRTIAGLSRSLGTPRVAAVLPPEAPNEVRLTVAWDLSWYQWEVQLADHRATVRALAKGSEVGELADADRSWNARASDDGRLQLSLGSNGAPS